MKERQIIGRNTLVEFIGYASNVPAKVDTGADSSSLWVSNLFVDEDHKLHFVLFDVISPHYIGQEIITDDFSVSKVRSSTGHLQIRYRTHFSVVIGGRKLRTAFTLADRSVNAFPVLIGRRTLLNRFLVDVSQSEYSHQRPKRTMDLNKEHVKDPHAFYKKYHLNNDEE